MLCARLNLFIGLLLSREVEGRKTAGVGLVRLESFVAEVCSSSPSWLDGPGTESKLLLEVEADIRNMYLLRFLRPKYSCLCFGAHLWCCGRCGRQEEAGHTPVLGGSINS